MRITDGCFECLLSRIDYECRLVTDNEAVIRGTVSKCRDLLTKIQNEPAPSPVIASRIHRLCYESIGSSDPYALLKEENNRVAAAICEQVGDSLVTFRDLCLAAVIGNTLDYGSQEHMVTDSFEEFYMEEFRKGLSLDDTDAILKVAARVVYFCDNCGEIVFDRLLIRYLKEHGSKVTVVVRGAPILNDATMKEATELGLERIADQVITGTDGVAELGLNRDMMTPALQAAIENCTLIIAKGMANYESMSEYTDLPPVAHLMSVKCHPIARSVGVPKGSRIALLVE